MKLKRMLFGPDWRSKDTDVRLRAVASDRDPELDQQLSLIAREDGDARVRLAALKRLDDPRRYLEAARDDGDANLRRQAHDLALRQLAGERPSTLDVTQRVLLVEEIRQAGELEALARTAREVEVRRAALARVRRGQVLVEAATADGDAALRLEALARIEDPALLKRVAEATRKTDKRVYRAAMERIEVQQLAADDPAAKRAQGERICIEAEALMRRPSGNLAAAATDLRGQWRQLDLDADHPLQARFRGALEVVDHVLAPRAKRAAEPTAAEVSRAHDEPVAGEEAATPIVAEVEESPAPPPKAAGRTRPAKAPPPDCSADLDRLAGLLAEGHVRDAREIEKHLLELRPRGPDAARFGELRAQLADMLRWQRWSMREQRGRICAEVETLIDSGMHPDALATRIRELREAWRTLESVAGEDAPEGIGKRFHALCHRALKPARGFFEKREALRGDHTVAAREMLAEIDAALEAQDLHRLRGLRRKAAETLRDAANLSSGERASIVAGIKRSLNAIDARLDIENSEILKRKEALLAEAEALAGGDPGKAVREVKRLQSEWKSAGMGSRRQEEPLWKRFRAACDQVFGALDSRRAEREAEAGAQRQEAQALIDRIESVEGLPEEAELREIRRLWRTLDLRDRELVRRFEAALAAIDARRDEVRQAALRGRLEAMLADAEAKHREAAAVDGIDEQAALLCVHVEFLAGVSSPDADRQRRMDFQVARLAERMAGGEEPGSLGNEVESILAAWRDLPIDPARAAPFAARIRVALDRLLPRL